jgi:hypothetical protein
LSRFSSLRELELEVSRIIDDHGTEPILGLLSSAVQGCLLKITDTSSYGSQDNRKVRSARASLVAERGSRNVPVLVLNECEDEPDEVGNEAEDEEEEHEGQQQQQGVGDDDDGNRANSG